LESKNSICPVCEEYYFESPEDWDICPMCGWENDGLQRKKEDFWGGANTLSVNESKKVYKLLSEEATRNKMAHLLNIYKQKSVDIINKFREIDHRTYKGERSRKAHKKFVAKLAKLYDKHK